MYRIGWFIEDAWDAVVYGVLSLICWLDNPKLWGNIKLLALGALTLFCAWGTVMVYNAPGTWKEPVAGFAVVTLFVLCTGASFLMIIHFGHEQAKRDALTG